MATEESTHRWLLDIRGGRAVPEESLPGGAGIFLVPVELHHRRRLIRQPERVRHAVALRQAVQAIVLEAHRHQLAVPAGTRHAFELQRRRIDIVGHRTDDPCDECSMSDADVDQPVEVVIDPVAYGRIARETNSKWRRRRVGYPRSSPGNIGIPVYGGGVIEWATGIVADEIGTVHIVDDAIAVIVDSVIGNLTGIRPDLRPQVVMVEGNPAIEDRNDDVRAAALDTPSSFCLHLEQPPLVDQRQGVTNLKDRVAGLGGGIIVILVDRISRRNLIVDAHHRVQRGSQHPREPSGSRRCVLRIGARRDSHFQPLRAVNTGQPAQSLASGMLQEPRLVGARMQLHENVAACGARRSHRARPTAPLTP